MSAEVGANPQAVTLAEIQKNTLGDMGASAVINTTEDGFLHDFDYALWAMRNQAARDKFEAPWGATFTVASCVTTANSTTVTTASSLTSVAVGQYISGTGIAVGSYVKDVGTGGFHISKPATAAGTVTLTFYPPCIGETYNRNDTSSVTIASGASGGVLWVSAVSLPINATISNLVFMPGTTGDAGPDHQWMGLWDWRGNQLCASADATSTAITASTPVVYPVASSNLSASATSFTTTYTGMYYLGLSLHTGNSPTLTARASFTGTTTLPPIICGTGTYAATPPTYATALGTVTPTANRYYFYCY